MTQNSENNLQVRNSLVTLAELRKGEFASDLSKAIAKLTKAVREHEASGSITVKLTFKPSDGAINAIIVNDDIKSIPPRAKNCPTLMFGSEDGELTREDPLQTSMDLEQKIVRFKD